MISTYLLPPFFPFLIVPPAFLGPPSKSSMESLAAGIVADRLGGPDEPGGGGAPASGVCDPPAPASGVAILDGGAPLTTDGAIAGDACDETVAARGGRAPPPGGPAPMGGGILPLTFRDGGAEGVSARGGGDVAAGVVEDEVAPTLRLTHFLVSGSKKKELSSPSLALWTVGAFLSSFLPPNQPPSQPDFLVSRAAVRWSQ